MLRSAVEEAERRDWFDELVASLWRAEPAESDRLAARAGERAPAIRPPLPDEILFPVSPARGRGTGAVLLASFCVAALGLGWVGGLSIRDRLAPAEPKPAATLAIDLVVERIIRAESGGDWNARNKRSTAAGGGQFLDATWLDMIRAHRPDLLHRGEKQALELRFDAALTREMTARFAERNAAMLSARGLPVTPATLYLSHFAGGGGAVALLTAPDHVDAATVMASADTSGQLTREKIVKANPFLDGFTVADLRSWGERRMDASRTARAAEPGPRPAAGR